MDVRLVSAYIILQYIVVVVAIALVLVAVGKRRVPRSFNFILYTFAVAIAALGYLLEITAPTFDAAVVACKVQYFGLPFLGVFYYLFMRDYCNMPVRGRLTVPLLMILPVVSLVLVFSWPLQHLFYADLSFVAGDGFSYLVVTPGPFYVVNFIYGYLLSLGTFFVVIRAYLRSKAGVTAKGRRHLVVFILASLLVLGAQVFKLVVPPASGFDYMPLVFTINAALLEIYLVRYRVREWTVLGRDSVVEEMKDAFILLDAAGNYLDANVQAMDFLPGLRTAKYGSPIGQVEGMPEQLTDTDSPVNELTLEGEQGEVRLRVTRTDLYAEGEVVGTCILLYDVSEIYQLMGELRQLATLDSLTGIYNRGTFFLYAQRDFDLALRKHENASLLMMDLDHFKRVNDAYGHQAGDMVLVTLAGMLGARLRHTDIIGRYGGEEIAVWLPGANAQGAALIADVIRRALEHTPFESEAGSFHVTLSIGVAQLDPAHHQSLEMLIADADAALYQAKEGGRNRVVTHRPARQG